MIYEFNILKEANPDDKRTFASYDDCEEVMDKIFHLTPNDKNLLEAGLWVAFEVDMQNVVEFHQFRREATCCSRIKWRVKGCGEGTGGKTS